MTDDLKKKYREIFKGPYVYDDHGQFIRCQNGFKILDVRGWGRLHTTEGMSKEDAADLQDEFGRFVAEILNTSL